MGFKEINPRTHGKVIRALQAPTKRKLIVTPRGCFKSTIASIAYPIWLLINNPDLRILIDSELYTNSVTYLRSIKGLIQSDKFMAVFGDWLGPVWNEGEIIIKSRRRAVKEGSVVCGGVGKTIIGMHFDVIIMDDMNSPANSGTPENCQKIIDHYRYSQSILEPDGTMCIIGTRYNALDLIGVVLDTLKQENKIHGSF